MPTSDTQSPWISSQRRSQRVLLRVPVVLRRQLSGGEPVTEQSATVAINAHGALITMKLPVSDGEQLVLQNPRTRDEQVSRVVYIGQIENDSMQVGIEFLRPAPAIWGIGFPPDGRTRTVKANGQDPKLGR